MKQTIVDNEVVGGGSVKDIKEDIVAYNFTQGIFGYGDDMRDWMNRSEKWVELENLEILSDGKVRIWWEE